MTAFLCINILVHLLVGEDFVIVPVIAADAFGFAVYYLQQLRGLIDGHSELISGDYKLNALLLGDVSVILALGLVLFLYDLRCYSLLKLLLTLTVTEGAGVRALILVFLDC